MRVYIITNGVECSCLAYFQVTFGQGVLPVSHPLIFWGVVTILLERKNTRLESGAG